MADHVKSVALNAHVEVGTVTPQHFTVSSVAPPSLTDGVLLRVVAVSVDPYMRGRMRSDSNYLAAPFKIGAPVDSGAVARVLQSNLPNFAVGDIVEGFLPWQEQVALPAAAVGGLNKVANPHNFPLHYWIGAMGMPGFTAWHSVKTIARPVAGETAFVSGAAGAVGMLVGQLLKTVYGCRVVGSAGTDEKVAHLTEQLGFDAAFNYKTTTTAEGLAKFCPEGINIYFDNVGGETLEAALNSCVRFARVVCCGSISSYDKSPGTGYGVKNLFKVVTKEIKMEGFLAFTGMAQPALAAAFQSEMSELLSSGKVKAVITVTQGLENVGTAFVEMMAGKNLGKAVVVCE